MAYIVDKKKNLIDNDTCVNHNPSQTVYYHVLSQIESMGPTIHMEYSTKNEIPPLMKCKNQELRLIYEPVVHTI